MSESIDSRREQLSTYFVQDRSNKDEMVRLQIQDEMLTTSMGGVLPEQPEPVRFQSVLDVGCGTGGWLIETAQMYPHIPHLIGIDVSKRMIDYAQAQVEALNLGDRIEFYVMDALRTLEFPDSFFDLVNQRFGASFIRTWEWPEVLSEYQRVSKPDGVIRITEANFLAGTSSSAFEQLNQLFLQAYYQSGSYYTPEGNAVIGQLARLLSQYTTPGAVQTRSYTLEYRSGTPEGQRFVENQKRIFRTALPFLQKWVRVPADYEEMYQRMLTEMQQPDFVATWKVLTAWGRKSSHA